MKNVSGLPGPATEANEIDLLVLFNILFSKKYLIIFVALVFSICAYIYTVVKTPIYVATVLIQLEKNPQSSLINNMMLNLSDARDSAATEIGIFKSRKVLGKASDDLGLQIVAKPNSTSIIRRLLSHLSGEITPRISVAQFTVPPLSEDKTWTLTVLDGDRYQLQSEDNQTLTGKVNQPVNGHGVSLNISGIDAPPGTTFSLTKRSRLATINDLLQNIKIIELEKGGELLQVSFSGTDPQMIAVTLETISQSFMQEDLQRKAEETSKSLAFVNDLLPGVLQKLNQADDRLHQFKEENSSVDLSLEAKEVLESSVSIQAQKNQLTLAKAELSKLYTKDHPLYRALLEKEKFLLKEQNLLAQKITTMPKKQQDFLSIKREVEAEHEIYMQLLAKQNELSIVKASTVASIRIIDDAVTDLQPTGAKKTLVVLMALMLGLIMSSGYYLLKFALRSPLEDPDQIERYGVDVLASIPVSKWLQRRKNFITHPRNQLPNPVWLAQHHADCLAIEALRSLRTGLLITLSVLEKRSVLISSATPHAGKTFISANLASVMASTGKRVIIIDADLRRGHIHSLLGMTGDNGLSEVLRDKMALSDVVQHTSQQGVDFISRGETSIQSSELLACERFAEVIQWAEQHYDYVIIDTPPILAVTDAAIVAQHVGLSLLVVRYAMNSVQDLEFALRRLYKSGVQVDGVIFNAVEKGRSAPYEYDYYSSTH